MTSHRGKAVSGSGRFIAVGLAAAVRLCVLVYCLHYVSVVLDGLLNGLEQSRFTLFAQFVSLAASLLLSLPLTAFGALTGALVGRGVYHGSRLATSALLLRAIR